MSSQPSQMIGPVYGVPLLESLPLGKCGMEQALPRRDELAQVYKCFPRVACGYEALLAHYHELVQEKANVDSMLEELTMHLSAGRVMASDITKCIAQMTLRMTNTDGKTNG